MAVEIPRRTKIVATLGPATSSYEQIRAIIDAGVDVARRNLSHGSYDVHEGVYQNVRKAANDSGRAVAVLVDLQGPKIRIAKFRDGRTTLVPGASFVLDTECAEGDAEHVGLDYPELVRDAHLVNADEAEIAKAHRDEARRCSG